MVLEEIGAEQHIESLGNISRGLTSDNVALLRNDIEVVDEGAIRIALSADLVKLSNPLELEVLPEKA
jgi:hypothetical protein